MVDGIKGAKSPFLLRPGAAEAGNLPAAIERLKRPRESDGAPAPQVGRPEAASLPAVERAANQPATALARSAPVAQPAPLATALSRDLAAAPPVNAARVAEIRQALEAGTLRPDAERIASAMIAQEAVFLTTRD
jgi:negative regulator of flagellin synthesis FlgM